MPFQEILLLEYWGNSVQNYLIAAGIIIGGLLLIRIFKRYLLRRVRKFVAQSDSRIDDFIVSDVEQFVLPVLGFLFVYWGISSLNLSYRIERIVQIAISVVTAIFILRFISSTLRIVLSGYIRRQENGEAKVKQIGGLMIIFNIVIWILGTIFLIDNLGYDVTTILTGVGIGGIAVALAAQNIVGDLFNYFVIFFDKPFEVGDAINVDGKVGTIEYIGVKTTRLRSISGEQIIISNSDLTKSRVHNYKRQENRRVQFNVNVVYQTSIELLARIPEILKSIITDASNTRFDRAHFSSLSEYGLTYEVVYYVTIADYNQYMDIQQQINLRILEAFQKENINLLIREDRFPYANDNVKVNGAP